ncbi:MAG: phage tail protein [Desulfovibrio sp.]|nr:phage tail protein [Desulfovibrio sp.]
MPKCYQYTADGYFAGEVEDYGLLPNNATRTAPTVVDGKVPRWTGKKWEQVEDHKGKSGYVNGQPHEIKGYGPLPDGWSDTPPPPALADMQATKRAEITIGFTAAMAASLAMPSATIPPAAYEVATALYDWRMDDPEGYADLLAIHEARRDALLTAVSDADSDEAVQAIAVSYAV